MYLTRLMGYDYEIHYRPGKTNVVVDALSRILLPSSNSQLLWSVPCLTFLDELKQHLVNDPIFLKLRDTISDDPTTYLDIQLLRI